MDKLSFLMLLIGYKGSIFYVTALQNFLIFKSVNGRKSSVLDCLVLMLTLHGTVIPCIILNVTQSHEF